MHVRISAHPLYDDGKALPRLPHRAPSLDTARSVSDFRVQQMHLFLRTGERRSVLYKSRESRWFEHQSLEDKATATMKVSCEVVAVWISRDTVLSFWWIVQRT